MQASSLSSFDFAALAVKLRDDRADWNAKLALATDLRDQIEFIQSNEYASFLALFVPVFAHLLGTVPVAYQNTAPEQKLRLILLETMQRLPVTEAAKAHAAEIMRIMMETLRADNEENATISLRVIIELHKNFRNMPALEDFVQPFFDIVKSMLLNMEKNVVEQIDQSEVDTLAYDTTMMASDYATDKTAKTFLPSVNSFRVLSECPIILVLLFQIYKKFLSVNIPALIPMIIKAIGLRAALQKGYTMSGSKVVGINPKIRNKTAYAEFVSAQVKIMSFLAFIIRGYAQLLKPHQQMIADALIHLLHDCPSETAATRKELLVAARHILTTDFRVSFVAYLDVLFEEEVLVGAGITSRESLRPLAYSMLADLIHHVRQELTPSQITRTVRLYTQNLHDSTLAPNIQTMCAKLLLNLIECVVNNSNKEEARRLLMRMFDAFTRKFTALKVIFPKLRKIQSRGEETMKLPLSHSADDIIDLDTILPIHTSILSDVSPLETVKDFKFLFKTLILGLKTIVYGVKSCNTALATVPAHSSIAVPKPFSQDEETLFVTLFMDGLSCFQIFRMEHPPTDAHATLPSGAVSGPGGPGVSSGAVAAKAAISNKEEKEILEHFVTVFTLVDQAVFQEVLNAKVEFLFDLQLENPTMLAIPQYLLASETVSSSFAGILLHFLMKNLAKLGGTSAYSALMLRLFKLIFMAVTLFPETNEVVLQPHIHDLITNSMKLASTATESNNYFMLLRALFRNIGGGRFELLYKEVLPLLPSLLKGLNQMLTVADKAHMRELFVELCLTVPVRLSVLLPYLGYLTRPLVLALEAGPELVSQGLRTLELCIDNLTADFLDPILAPVINDLMAALWKHLRPLPYNQSHAHATLRILGKLGGRNRRILKDAAVLKYTSNIEGSLHLPIPFEGRKQSCIIALDKSVQVAQKILGDATSSEHDLKHAFQFVRGCLPLLVDVREGTEKLAEFITSNSGITSTRESLEAARAHLEMMDAQLEKANRLVTMHEFVPSAETREAQSKTLTTLLQCVISAAACSKLQEEAKPLMKNLVRHFTILKVAESIGLSRRTVRSHRNKRHVDYLDSTILMDAIIAAMSCPAEETRKMAGTTLDIVFEVATLLVGSLEGLLRLPMVNLFASKFCSSCYSMEWFQKLAGCHGVTYLSSREDLGQSWQLDHMIEFTKALLNILKDVPVTLAGNNVEKIRETLLELLRRAQFADDPSLEEKRATRRKTMLNLMVTELSNTNSTVRDVVHEMLSLMADLNQTPVSELLRPIRERFLAPIFMKPLRALPFSMQIGNIDAIAYCLQLQPSLIDFDDQLIRLLHETLGIADADDQALISKSNQHKNMMSLTNLRIVCVRLLSAAMANNDFSASPNLNAIRFRIVQVFFKSLYSKSDKVIEAAKDGLRQAIAQQNRLPKELLQTGLRPILLNLSDHKRLTVEGMQGLARLLELLTNYFKVEIGRKLLDHLQQWASPAVLEAASGRLLDDCNEIRIIVSIMEVIHLLPPAAVMFMEDMVRITVALEEALRRDKSSPFRKPLLTFLTRFPAETVRFFFERIGDYNYGRLFANLLELPAASNICDEIMRNGDLLVATCFAESQQSLTVQTNGVLILKAVLGRNPSWIGETPNLASAVLRMWRSPERKVVLGWETENADIAEMIKWKGILDILLIYSKSAPSNLELLLDVIDVCCGRSTLDFTDVKFFVYEMCNTYSVQQRNAIVAQFLDLAENAAVSNQKKMYVHRLLVMPCLLQAKADGQLKKVLTQPFLDRIFSLVWSSAPYQSAEGEYSDAIVRMELLQLTTFLIENAADLVGEHRKDVIKFAWNFIKSEESMVRQAAYVVLSTFISVFEAPTKIVAQIFVTLLRSYQSEARALVKQALDILAPALPFRLNESSSSSQANASDALTAVRSPTWVRWTRRILVEDGHLLPQLISIWQFIIRHEELFFWSREQFVQQIVTSLGKLGLTPNATSDTRTLTIDLVELILKWERRRMQEMAKSQHNMDVDPVETDSPRKRRMPSSVATASPRKKTTHPMGETELTYTPAQSYREMIVNYLIRFVCTVNEPLQRKGMSARIIQLVEGFFSPDMWPDVNVKIAFLEKYFSTTDITEANVANIPNILQVLRITFEGRSIEWFVGHLPHLQSCVQKILAHDHVKIVDGLVDILSIVYGTLNEDATALANVSSFTQLIMAAVIESLQTGRNIYGATSVLNVIQPQASEYLVHLLKLFQRLCKEYPPFAPTQPPPIPTITAILKICLNTLNGKLVQLGEGRKTFLGCMALLIDRSNDASVHRTILDILRGWIFGNTTVSVLSLKEKCTMIQKFAVLERRAEKEIFADYLRMVIEIFRSEALVRTELTVRMEPIFLLGTRCDNPELRSQFLHLFDKYLPKNLYVRLSYIFGVQNWEAIASSFWLRQALYLVFGCVKSASTICSKLAPGFRTVPIGSFEFHPAKKHTRQPMVPDAIEELLTTHRQFLKSLQNISVAEVVENVQELCFADVSNSYETWVNVFCVTWSSLMPKEQHDIGKLIVSLLAREYHMKQSLTRPNVIQALLEGIAKCSPTLILPPQLIKYLAKNFDTWYIGLELLEVACSDSSDTIFKDASRIKASAFDATADIYHLLSENDLFLGLWRSRCAFQETNAALSFEQLGMWQKAQSMYENAQLKARGGLLPFNASEFTFFEERWITCTKKLQQWDLLMDLAKHDSNVSLQLDSAWRITDWNSDKENLQHLVSIIADPPTPRTKTYEAFLALSNLDESNDKIGNLQKVCDDGLQCSLRKWVSMPSIVSQSHIPLLHSFQQFVELQEASHIYLSVGLSNLQSRLQAVHELKGTLGTWRDRLPNLWDDINIWSELVAWRQHVFSVINKAYQPLADQPPSGNSLAYRGYHEIAWIINRFARVARKHHLIEVCVNALTKIYTLPNIEITDAFLKLKEQAKCYFQNPADLVTGLEVINNTNLGYFQNAQRAEFFAMKGIFLSQLEMVDDANTAFSTAIQVEMNLAKGWAAWGQFNDEMFMKNTAELSLAVNAVNCYLNAAGLMNNSRARKYLARVLWLLGFDDETVVISNAFESYKGDMPTWYWIYFIPQLITSLGRVEAKHANTILMLIAKTYPQALYFLLRTANEELAARPSSQDSAKPKEKSESTPMQVDEDGRPEEAMDTDGVQPNADMKFEQAIVIEDSKQMGEGGEDAVKEGPINVDIPVATPSVPRTAQEHVQEIMSILKTAYPLLALTMETMVDQFLARLKPSPEEDVYRIVMALLTDGYQQLIHRVSTGKSGEKFPLTPSMRSNIEKFLASPYVQVVKHKKALEEDFLRKDLDVAKLVQKYAEWRDILEMQLENRPKQQHLEHFSHYLVEFEHQKFDDMEIPGQYLALRDSNSDFIRLDRFRPIIEFVRGNGIWHRQVTFIGHDGSEYVFKIQNPSGRNSRREERMVQLFRIMNSVLEKKKESRQRNLSFHLPVIVPLAPNVRLVQDDSSCVSLQDILEGHCQRKGGVRDATILRYLDFIKEAIRHRGEAFTEDSLELQALQMDAMQDLTSSVVPSTVLSDYFLRSMRSYPEFWTLRKQFTSQLALLTFQSYALHIGNRLPHKFQVSRKTGNIWMSDLLPSLNTNLIMANAESVPFRFTPNMQRFMTNVGVEGTFIASLASCAVCLTKPEYDLNRYLGLMLRDELTNWQFMSNNVRFTEADMHEKVEENTSNIMQRIEELSCKTQRERTDDTTIPVVQPILDLISDASNPQKLAQMDVMWQPWF